MTEPHYETLELRVPEEERRPRYQVDRGRYRVLAWFSTSLIGRYIHRAMHPQDQTEACRFCRAVWWRLFAWRVDGA